MKKKNLISGLVGIVFILTMVFIFKHHHANAESPPATVVEAERVTIGNIPIEATAVGTLSADKSVQITPEFAGKVAAILFQDGTFVKQGAPLIQLDNIVYKAKAESAKAALFYSDMNYKRMQTLSKQGAVTRQAVDAALADLKAKQADAQETQVACDKMLLTAPFDGVLSKSKVSLGDYVTVGQSLVDLTDIQHLRVEYTVSEKYLPQLKLGQDIVVTTNDYPGKNFTAKVSYISPTINIEDRTISLYANLSNDDRLLTAGLFVNVRQALGVQANTVLISPQALVSSIDGQQVYKIIKDKVQSVTVKLGQRTIDSVQITEGLSPNDMIVKAGQEKLRDGAFVKIKPEEMKSLS